MIQGYPWPPSVAPGRTLQLHVSTDAPRFRVELYRQHDALRAMGSSGWFTGRRAASKDAATDWAWPAVSIPIPGDWPSGVYLAVLRPDEGDAPVAALEVTSTEGSDRALFVVVPADPGRRARILYKVPLMTYHAYNHAGGGNLYRDTIPAASSPGCKVTMKRPGGGITVGACGDPVPDAHDPSSPRQVFAHWDAPFLQWLARTGIAVDCCTDLDVHVDPGLLAPYRLILSVGHDEYWTPQMRDHLAAFVDGGGNLALFSGNVCWWRITLADGDTAIVCDKQLPDQWWRRDPENALTGVSYRGGGGWWTGAREALGYTITASRSWLFAGTGLGDGDVLGAGAHLVGYECDGADVDHRAVPTCRDGSPRNFAVVGIAALSDGWEERMTERPAATMGLHNRNGTVFTAATTDWARVLAIDPQVEQVTRNVIDRLSRRTAGQRAIDAITGVQAIAGGATSRNGRCAVVATCDGAITLLAWQPGQRTRRRVLAHVASPVCGVAIAPAGDQAGAAIVAGSDGELLELSWRGDGGVERRVVARLDLPIIAAGLAATGGDRLAAIAARDGAVIELAWQPGGHATPRRLARFDGPIAGIAAYVADARPCVVVATRGGELTRLERRAGAAVRRDLLARGGEPIGAVAGYDSPVDRDPHIIVATEAGALRALFWIPDDDDGVRHDVLPQLPERISAIAAFADPGGTHHVLVATADGEIRDLYRSMHHAASR
jgi:hypothetical protein